MNTTTYVWVKHQFESLHFWPNAPDQVDFLKHYHRHMFHVELRVRVSHDDRDVEFITLKKELVEFCRSLTGCVYHKSCEMLAGEILEDFAQRYTVARVAVSEDGENGAILKVNA